MLTGERGGEKGSGSSSTSRETTALRGPEAEAAAAGTHHCAFYPKFHSDVCTASRPVAHHRPKRTPGKLLPARNVANSQTDRKVRISQTPPKLHPTQQGGCKFILNLNFAENLGFQQFKQLKL